MKRFYFWIVLSSTLPLCALGCATSQGSSAANPGYGNGNAYTHANPFAGRPTPTSYTPAKFMGIAAPSSTY